MIFLFARFAKNTNQTLRQHCFERRGNKIGFDSHINQPGERAGGIVRVRVREASPINLAQLQVVSGSEGTGNG